ncbi:MAG: hypothetical protein JNK47_22450 [Mesorhizobium sp.]|nr:hypothetical protein [Mesorhizobium sp.]MBL8579975.1 hypothetical protein [Mesorhizobium sp.]
MSDEPKILILTPVKSAAAHLPRYVELVETLDWPQERLSLGMLESDSVDETLDVIDRLRPRLEARCSRVTVSSHAYGFSIPAGQQRWTPSYQMARRKILARSRNRLLFSALRDEDWVLWIDVDMIDYPPDIISRLLATGFNIVTPHAVTKPGGESFDRNSWADQGKTLLEDRRGSSAVRLDSVGGTILMIRADLHREGLIFPPFPYGRPNHRIRVKAGAWGAGEIETEGLGIMASDMGVQCWGLPDLEVLHHPN